VQKSVKPFLVIVGDKIDFNRLVLEIFTWRNPNRLFGKNRNQVTRRSVPLVPFLLA
jgi:hypothetical protein